MKHSLFILTCWICTVAHGQQIQWAQKADFAFNAYGKLEYSEQQVTGPPNAFPWGELNPAAFRLKEEASFGTLVVAFEHPQTITHLIVVESHHPGSIQDITLYDDKGNQYDLYIGYNSDVSVNHRVFCVGMEATKYKVSRIKLNINTNSNRGWSQVDAIGVAHSPSEDVLKNALESFGQELHFEFQPSFASGKVRLSKNVNSSSPEVRPVISPDGNTLYFTRVKHPENMGGRRDGQDIYYSERRGDDWSPAKNLGSPLNNTLPNGLSSISPDGNTALLINSYEDLYARGVEAAMAQRNGSGWSKPEVLEIESYYNRNTYADFYLSNSGKVLLMAIEDRTSLGDQDLYVSFLQPSGSWSAPKNLGRTINTSGAEFSPFLAADGKTLYFASTGHKGLGASDIFYTKRLDESWTEWSEPVNLGPAVNTEGWDAYYSISASGDVAYFVYGDPKDERDRDVFRIALPKEFKPEPVLLIKGKVLDSITKAPIGARVFFESLQTGEEEGLAYSDPETGYYQIVLQRGQQYGYLASAEGYISVNEQVDLTQFDSYQEIEQNLYLIPLKVGQIFTLNNVLFERSKTTILPQSYPELNRLAKILLANPTLIIEVSGHTDNVGTRSAKLRLSEQRAQVVKAYLENQGVNPKQIQAAGYGGSRPTASNATEETRKLNRRVEVEILDY